MDQLHVIYKLLEKINVAIYYDGRDYEEHNANIHDDIIKVQELLIECKTAIDYSSNCSIEDWRRKDQFWSFKYAQEYGLYKQLREMYMQLLESKHKNY